MTDKAKPLSRERRRVLMGRIDRGQQIFGGAKLLLQGYEATVAQVEAELARATYDLELETERHGVTRQAKGIAVEAMAFQVAALAKARAERDAYQVIAELFIDGGDPKAMAHSYRAHAAYFGRQGKENSADKHLAWAEALEALPE